MLGAGREGSSGSEKDEKDQDFDVASMPVYLQLFDALTQVHIDYSNSIISAIQKHTAVMQHDPWQFVNCYTP
jgi:hypothetical protein